MNSTDDKKSVEENGKKEESKAKIESEKADGDWDTLYNDSGECLVQDLEKLSLGNKKAVEAKEPVKKIDYLKFDTKSTKAVTKETDEEEKDDSGEFDSKYAHIVEIYDFPTSFKNENIINAFKDQVGNQNFSLKWVDDTHCLGIFSNVSDATQALQIANPMVKARPISQASSESKQMAKRKIDSLRPFKARPQTSSLVASKLIGASLGLKGNLLSKEKVEMERNKLKEAKEKRRNDKDLKDAAWNGDL